MNKLFKALIVSDAAVSGFYWFTKSTAIGEAADVIIVNIPRRATDNRSISVISEPADFAELNRAQATSSKQTTVADELTVRSGIYIATDGDAY